MSLQFYLVPNQITDSDNDFRAVSKSTQNYTIEDVYDLMTRQGSTITKAEALAAFEEIVQGIISLVKEGNSVVTPLVNIGSRVAGVFNGDDDSFDKSRHSIRITVNPGSRLRKVSEMISVSKVASVERQPSPLHFIDSSSDSQDDIVTPTGGARITGSLLKHDPEDPEQGIFFVNSSDGSEVRVDSSLLRNKPGELIFINPELPAGEYRLEIRSLLDGTTAIRTGSLSNILTVS
jgi:hypothetical protein